VTALDQSGAEMDRQVLSTEDHDFEYLARKHGTTVAKVKEIALQTGTRSREQIDAALNKFGRKGPRRLTLIAK
jgi:translation initiation factor 2 beta subunit (eIF-2beta)/eIF-5